jgi:hypothetical protein
MPGFDGTGPAGRGPMTGGGRGFCSPWGMGGGRGRYAFPRWPGYANPYYAATPYPYWAGAQAPPMTAEQEIEGLRTQSQMLAQHLDDIQRRLAELEKTG